MKLDKNVLQISVNILENNQEANFIEMCKAICTSQ